MNNDEQAILKLMNDYCFLIDGGDLQGFADLFSHGTWLVQGDPTGGDTGSGAVMETLQNIILYDGKPNTKHVMSNIQLTMDAAGDTARAQCYITVYQAVPPDFPLQPILSATIMTVSSISTATGTSPCAISIQTWPET